MDQEFIDQEIQVLEGQHRDAVQQAHEWSNTALRIEGALVQMRKLRGRFNGVASLQSQEGAFDKPIRQGGDDKTPNNGAYQNQGLGQESAQLVNGPMP